eukprot:CAMPEP_0201508816 /NCGR_PEP_ID=MMETSP0161_2-20130828/2051_1 /ASSEMBLY_ACC=CAM_ASM_000251 /TAXON_ID=180227 /ORGANISM="Neoparamoeba aestuarina, Strain SoJaBio B1-5/56/2" /LENGTH=544 /DNA_ID=CAMNT_0047903585 /DNA_START=112 /DNA_END=1746 /DNA_ORIENTATION=+
MMENSSDLEDVLDAGDDDAFLKEHQWQEDEKDLGEEWDFEGGGKKKFFSEISEIMILALGALVARISYVVMKTTDSALLGHSSADALTVSSYSDLWTSAVGVFLTSGVLSMFVGNAIGSGNPKIAGVWLQVSTYFILFMCLPVMILWFLTSPVLQLFGVSKDMANQAGYYSSVLAICLPFRSVYRQLAQFLAAQKIIYPGTVTGIAACTFNLVLGLILVLGIPIPNWDGFGFYACPVVTLTAEIFMSVIFYLVFFAYLRLHDPCWDGRDPSLLTDWEKYKEFGRFYLPSALAAASDWWRVTVIGVVAAYLGPNDLVVFNTSYRILWMSLTIVSSLAAAISIKLGIFVGVGDISAAKQMIMLGTGFVFFTLFILCFINWVLIEDIAHIFTDQEEIVELFVESRMGICCMLFVMNFAVFLETIPNTLGKNKEVLYTGLIGSWCGQVPAVLGLCIFVSWSLDSVYMGASIGYALTCILLIIIIMRIDWDEAVKEAKERSGVGKENRLTEGDDDDDEVWGIEGEIEMQHMGVDWEKFVEEEEDQDIEI